MVGFSLLPDSWTEDGNVTLRVVVDPRSNYSDPNRSNNETSVALTFNDKAPPMYGLCAGAHSFP